MTNRCAPRLCTLGLGLATALLCLPASLAFGPDKPLYVHSSRCTVHGRERKSSTTLITRPWKLQQWGALALARTSTNATAGAISVPSPSPPPFHARAPRQSCSKNSRNGVVTCDLSSTACCAYSGYDVCPQCDVPDEVEGEDGYELANKCIALGGASYIQEYTAGGTSVTKKQFKSQDCTGDYSIDGPFTLGKCFAFHDDKTGIDDGGIKFEVTKDVQIGTAAFIEMYESMGACEGLTADPVVIIQEDRGCLRELGGTPHYVTTFCQGGMLKVYECDDSSCTKNCAPYIADTTINNCVPARSVLPAADQQIFPSTWAIKTQDPTCF